MFFSPNPVPSTSDRQHHFFLAIQHGWKIPGKKSPPVSVANDFLAADKAQGKWQGASQPTKAQQIGTQLQSGRIQ